MTDRITLRVADIIGSALCIASEDGQKIFDKLVPLIRNGKHIVISFERISIIISLFLNAAIGQLYGTFSEEQIRSQLEVSNLAEDDVEMLKRVVENAKSYYANREGYDKAWKKESSDEE
jgi:hypothetical protein